MDYSPQKDDWLQGIAQKAQQVNKYVNPVGNAVSEAMKPVADPVDPYAVQAQDIPMDSAVQGNQSSDADERASREGETTAVQQLLDVPGGPKKAAGVVEGGFNFEPGGGYELAKDTMEQGKAFEDASEAFGKSQAEEAASLAAEKAVQNQRYSDLVAHNEKVRQESYAAIKARIDNLDKEAQNIANTKIQKGQLFNNPLTVFSSIMLSFTPLIGGDPQAAVKMIDSAIQRDLDVQQTNLTNRKTALVERKGLLNDYVNLVKDEDLARLMSEKAMRQQAMDKLDEISQRYKSPQILAQTEMTKRAMHQQNNVLSMEIYQRFFQNPKIQNEAIHNWWGPGAFQRLGELQKQQAGIQPNAAKPAEVPTEQQERPEGVFGAFGTGAAMRGLQEAEDRTIKIPPTEISSKAEKGQSGPVATKKDLGALDARETLGGTKYFYGHNPALGQSIEKQKAQLWPTYVRKHKGDYDKAYAEWHKDVMAAENDVKNIATAAEKFVPARQAVADLEDSINKINSKMDPEKKSKLIGAFRRFGFAGVDDFLYKAKQEIPGWTSEDDLIARRFLQKYRYLQTEQGKAMLGAITTPDGKRLDSFMPDNPTWDQLVNVTNMMSKTIQSQQSNAEKTGNVLARALYQAGYRPLSKNLPSPSYGIRQPKSFSRTIEVPPIEIK